MRMGRGMSIAIGCLVAIHALVLFAGFVAPYNFDTQERFHPFAPPTRIHFFDSHGRLHFRPFVYALHQDEVSGEYREDQSVNLPIRFFTTGEEYRLLGVWRCRVHLFGVSAPARIYLLGADGFGRDQLSRVLYGGRISLFAGLLAASLSVFLGLA